MDSPRPGPPPRSNARSAGWLTRLVDVDVWVDFPHTTDLHWWRARVLDRLLATFFAFAVVALVPSILASLSTDSTLLLVIGPAFVPWFAVLWRVRSLGHRVRASILLASMFGMAAVLLVLTGSRGAGFIWMFGFVVLAGVLLGRGAALRALALGAVTLAGFTVVGHRPPLDGAIADWRLMWAVLGGNTVLLGAATVAAVSGLVSGLGSTLRQGERLREDLQRERDALARTNAELATEITRREAAEHERETLRTRLSQAERMDALGRLARGIAHDLNNLLQPIVVHGELLREAMPEGSEARENAAQVLASADHAADLVRQVLTFGREATPSLETVEVSALIDQAMALLDGSAVGRHRVVVAHTGTPVHTRADPTQLKQVLLNLCNNALQAMARGPGALTVASGTGRPRLQARAHHRDHTAGVDPITTEDTVWFTVTDTGPGMPPEVVDRAFEPFFTTRSGHGGTGLGLSIVHGVVMSLGGTLIVSTGPDEGTCFAVVLPRQVPVVASPDERPGSTAAGEGLG